MSRFTDTTYFEGMVVLSQGFSPPLARTSFLQEDAARLKLPWDGWRVHDALQTNLPGTAASDDLALTGGTFGSASPSLQTGDVKTTTVTMRARCQISLPHTYVAGETVTLRLRAGMLTTVCDGAGTIDAEVYRSNDEAGIGSDLCTTSATTIKSLTLANKDFTITPATLAPGDTLDIRVTIAIADTATATAVIGILGAGELLLDMKG